MRFKTVIKGFWLDHNFMSVSDFLSMLLTLLATQLKLNCSCLILGYIIIIYMFIFRS